MLEDNYQQALDARLAATECLAEIPRALRQLFEVRQRIATRMDERRKFARFPALTKGLLEVATTLQGIERSPQYFVVLATDLSRHGVAFLHASQLFPGELFTLWLRVGKLPCRVVRCIRHNARCFEIGALFEEGPRTANWVREATGALVADGKKIAAD